ncbi:MAG: anthranilate synthase component I [Candidatus Liberibacter ctenarytainae]|uniref:Anthranilate synthase component I n=1 Tax=Candidatus Liberibacter ctenarytainae TaxID=2020335 RepID=A0A937AB87_9HYPH|nr:anthranilate synthase component I [Candidatus Liberibacter ctenarytainae]
MKILIVDYEDSFVYILADYFIQTGSHIMVTRSSEALKMLDKFSPDLVVLSPGPGYPNHFNCQEMIQVLRQCHLPIFGVCLGMQALAEAYGAQLRRLPQPYHGKSSCIYTTKPSIVFSGLETNITVGRYHSIYVDPLTVPKELIVTAKSDDGIIMGIEHISEPIAAVQFHPESIMSSHNNSGIKMIRNVVEILAMRTRNSIENH